MIRAICMSILLMISMPWSGDAFAKKEVEVKTPLEKCNAGCDAQAKKCALNPPTTLQNCIHRKEVCRDFCSETNGSAYATPTSAPQQSPSVFPSPAVDVL